MCLGSETHTQNHTKLVEVPKRTFDKPISLKRNQLVRLNFLGSAQADGEDNCNVQAERRLELQIHSWISNKG